MGWIISRHAPQFTTSVPVNLNHHTPMMKSYIAQVTEGSRVTVKTVLATDQDDAIHQINCGEGQLVASYDLPPNRTVVVREVMNAVNTCSPKKARRA